MQWTMSVIERKKAMPYLTGLPLKLLVISIFILFGACGTPQQRDQDEARSKETFNVEDLGPVILEAKAPKTTCHYG